MSPDNESGSGVREFRLEGLGLFVLVGAAVVLLVGAFWVGRWYERTVRGPASFQDGTAGASDSTAGDPAAVVEGEAEEGLTYFDTVEGGEKESETWREARPSPTVAPGGEGETAPDQPAPAAEGSGGPWFVQVFAGRDRASAENIAARLGDLGYPVKVHTVREGQTSLFKVGVGGFESREEADVRVAELKERGFESAWTNRFD